MKTCVQLRSETRFWARANFVSQHSCLSASISRLKQFNPFVGWLTFKFVTVNFVFRFPFRVSVGLGGATWQSSRIDGVPASRQIALEIAPASYAPNRPISRSVSYFQAVVVTAVCGPLIASF